MPFDPSEFFDTVQQDLGLLPAALGAILLLVGPTTAWLIYRLLAQPTSSRSLEGDPELLWVCERCRSANEARRSACYSCGLRLEAIAGDVQVVDREQLVTLGRDGVPTAAIPDDPTSPSGTTGTLSPATPAPAMPAPSTPTPSTPTPSTPTPSTPTLPAAPPKPAPPARPPVAVGPGRPGVEQSGDRPDRGPTAARERSTAGRVSKSAPKTAPKPPKASKSAPNASKSPPKTASEARPEEAVVASRSGRARAAK